MFRALVVACVAIGCRAAPSAAPTGAAPAAAGDVFTTLMSNAWYLPTADGKARIYVTEIGTGPTVIVLHGGPGNDFHYLVDALRPHFGRFHFVLFDQRGSLMSPVAPADIASVTLPNMVDDLDRLRAELGIPQVTLLGHSWGTFLAAEYYRAHPDRVAGIVLSAALPPQGHEGAGFMEIIKAAYGRMKGLRGRPEVAAARRAAGVDGDVAKLSPRALRSLYRINDSAINLWHVDRWPAYQGSGVYYTDKLDDAIEPSLPATFDTLAALAVHRVPITVVQGDHDFIDPGASQWAALTAQAPSVEVQVLDGAGHYGWIDNPDAFHRGIDHGLGRVSGAPAR
jgi:pimeloyl-ACP methyl ester carboxylesterase